MTLRGSEQSLLHNPVHCESGACAPARSRLFSRAILTCSALLVVTITLAFQAVGPLEKKLAEKNLWLATGFDGNPNEFWSIAQNLRPPTIEGDVIIAPLQNRNRLQFRQLTANSDQPGFLPFEISSGRALEMLASSGAGNIAISPELKFFATGTGNNIEACPSNVRPYDPLGNKEPACFLIDIQPSERAISSRPEIL